MVTTEQQTGQSDSRQDPGGPSVATGRVRALQICFCVFVVLLAVFQFSENTADVDLWGHVVFGQAMLKTHSIAKADIYSWTAAGHKWINHECLAEIALGGTHALLGGKGLLLLKMAVGLLSFGIALRLGANGLTWPERYVAWALGALAVVEISFGFAARPQIFTVLFIVLELALLKRIHARAYRWAVAMPVMFAIWINTHGGALAGFGLLVLAATATVSQNVFGKRESLDPNVTDVTWKTNATLWLTVLASALALLLNPWGIGLIKWLMKSVLWMRPEIEEWNPTPLGWDHATLFVLILLAAFAWIFTRRPRAWWQLAACAAFSVLALRSVRNTPLCAIVLMALVPPHLVSAIVRFQTPFSGLVELGRSASFQTLGIVLLSVLSLGTAAATVTLHKEHPFTMEIPSTRFPNAAVSFIREHDLRGKMLVFFDWGEMVIFSLPDCQPSIDGRLDTCYSNALIRAHWNLYNGDPFDETVLNVLDADLAMLPAKLAGTLEMAKRPNWQPVYFDDTAVVLVHGLQRFPKLNGLALPVKGPSIIGLGRVPFPDKSPRWKQP